MDALTGCSGKGSCYGDPLPGGSFFFWWVAVGSQRQSNCMNSEKGGGEYAFPMVGIYEKWKKEKWQQLWTVMSKNIYFSSQTLRRGLRERGGGTGDTQRRNQCTGLRRAAGQECALPRLVCCGFTARDHKPKHKGKRWPHICNFPNLGFKPDVPSAQQRQEFYKQRSSSDTHCVQGRFRLESWCIDSDNTSAFMLPDHVSVRLEPLYCQYHKRFSSYTSWSSPQV